MIQLPQPPENANIRTLAQLYREEFENITDTIVLTNTPIQTVDGKGLEAVFVDGVFRHPSAYTMEGKVLSWVTPLAGTEIVCVYYSYRS